MSRGQALKAKAPMKRRYKPAAARENREYALACYGEPCYLRIVPCAKRDTVVPCHSNQAIHGKGAGIKADDLYTVPGCMHCHYELDQGKNLSREQRKEAWDRAYARWKIARIAKMSCNDNGT